MKLAEAQHIASECRELLAPYCERIEIAGSVRRQAPDVKDIELVAIPKYQVIGFAAPGFSDVSEVSQVDMYLDILRMKKAISLIKNGPKQKQFEIKEYDIKIDLFLVTPPAQWGSIFAIRTGSAKYSKWLVTSRKYGGARPSYLDQRDGALWEQDKMIETPTEASYFEALGIGWLDPKDRRV